MANEELSYPAGLTAQVSIYPLRQQHLSPSIDAALAIWRDRGLDVQPGAMSTLIAGDETTVWEALRGICGRNSTGGDGDGDHGVECLSLDSTCAGVACAQQPE